MRLALVLLLVAACSKSEPTKSEAPPRGTAEAATARATKDPAKAREMITGGATVIDVRSTAEYDGDHLAQATNIPIDQLGSRLADVDKLVGGDKSKPVVVYCASGNRAGRATKTLHAQGYTNVVNGGGIDDLR